MPERIQRKRTRGWRMPSNCVYVGRPTEWGNRYRVGIDGTAEECVAKYRRDLLAAMQAFPELRYQIEQLRGKDLCCWCSLDRVCHADVILEVANK